MTDHSRPDPSTDPSPDPGPSATQVPAPGQLTPEEIVAFQAEMREAYVILDRLLDEHDE